MNSRQFANYIHHSWLRGCVHEANALDACKRREEPCARSVPRSAPPFADAHSERHAPPFKSVGSVGALCATPRNKKENVMNVLYGDRYRA